MKLIVLFALVAFASTAEKPTVNLVNPQLPDERSLTFDCSHQGREKPYCVRRVAAGSKLFQIKWAHRPKLVSATEKGYNCEGMNAANNFCCDPKWTPTSVTAGKRLSKRATPTPDESTIFQNILEDDMLKNCTVQPGEVKNHFP